MEQSQGASSKRPRRVWPIVVISFGIIVLLVVGWLMFDRYRGKAALAKYEKELRAKGEKLSFVELIKPVPLESNQAPELGVLCSRLAFPTSAPPIMQLIAPGKALVISKQEAWVDDKLKSYDWQNLEGDLNTNEETLAQIRQMLQSPVLQVRIQYRGASTLLPHLGYPRRVSKWFSSSCVYNIRRGDVKAAVDDVAAIVALPRPFEDEPFLISQAARILILTTGLDDSWQLLQTSDLPDAQLVRLQKIWAHSNAIDGIMLGLRGDRAVYRDSLGSLRRGETDFELVLKAWQANAEVEDYSPRLVDKLPHADEIAKLIRATVVAPLWRKVWSYDDERQMQHEVQLLLTASQTSKTNRSARSIIAAKQTLERKLSSDAFKSWRYLTTSMLVRSAGAFSTRAFRFETLREMTVTAIALKRHHLRHGKYPKSLEELVPEFLRERPVDWMDGQKLRYRLDGDSFVLWSVGEDGKDDGGVPDQNPPYDWWKGPDVVWPQPASEKEVEEYEKPRLRRNSRAPE